MELLLFRLFAESSSQQRILAMISPMDEAVKQVVHGLCERPFIGGEGGEGTEVDVLALIAKVLSEKEEAGGEGKSVHLEQKTKFWEATLEGDTVNVRYGKKKTEGQTNTHKGPDAAEYFEKKVREKLRGGYKKIDKDAALKKKILAAIKKEGDGAESDVKVVD